MINKISINNLGMIRDLNWDNLCNINVIIGKNNTGKTSVLSLDKEVEPEFYDLLEGMPHNSIIDEAIKIYEEEIDIGGI